MRRFQICLVLLCALLLTTAAAGAEYRTAADGTRYISAGQEHGDAPLGLQAAGESMEAVVDGVRYTLSGGSAAVAGYTEDIPADCVIPSAITVDGKSYTVTAIGESGLLNCAQLRTVTLPDTLTSIGGYAFSGCTGLTEITIPAGVTSFGRTSNQYVVYTPVFQDCVSLTSITVEEGSSEYQSIDGVLYSKSGSILYAYPMGRQDTAYSVPDGTVQICESAFCGAAHLTSVTLPDSVTTLHDTVFADCAALETIDLGDGLRTVGYSVFRDCSALRRLEFPATLETLNGQNYDSTNGQPLLEEFVVAEGCENYKTVDGVLFARNSDGSWTLWGYPASKPASSYEVPAEVTAIAPMAFVDASYLTSLTFAQGSRLTAIESTAFTACTGLTSLTIPDSVTTIGSYAFQNCFSLTEVRLSASLTVLEDGTFSRCESLTTLEIPAMVSSIADSAFEECAALTSFTVAEGNPVFAAVDGVLYEKLTEAARKLAAYPAAKTDPSVTIPADVTQIAAGAFSAAASLASIQVETGNPVFYAQDGVLFQQDGGTAILHSYPQGKTDTSYTVPEGVTVIGDNAFYNNSALTHVDASQVTRIGFGAFESARTLESIQLEQVTFLAQNALIFTGLRSITLPGTLTTFGDQILDFCYELEYIEFWGATPPQYEHGHPYSAGICYGSDGLRYVYVPQARRPST